MKRWVISISILLIASLGLTAAFAAENEEKPNKSLHDAAMTGDVEQLQLLISSGADVNARDTTGYTPLFYAVQSGQKKAAELLIGGGANVNARDGYGNTPLHFAAVRGHYDMCEVLVFNGADVGSRNLTGGTAVAMAKAQGHSQIAELLQKHSAKERFFVATGGRVSRSGARSTQGMPNSRVDYVAKINEISRAGRDESLNAAPFYQKAIELYVERPEELKKLDRHAWPAELSDKQQSLLKEWVQSNSQALLQLELGTQRPYYWLQKSSPDGSVIGILMPELAKFRQLCFAITWRAKLTAAEGNYDKAMKDIVRCYRFGLHQVGPKSLVEQLVGIAIKAVAVQTAFEILDRTKMDRASLKTLQSQIEQLSAEESYMPDIRFDKFNMLDIIQRMFTDDGKGDGRILTSAETLSMISDYTTLTQEEIQSLPELRRRQTTEVVEKLYEYFDFVGQKTPWQWKNEQINPEKEIEKIMEGNPLVQIFCPAFVRVAQIFARCRAETDALITTLALLRYKADRGQLPEKLDELELVSVGYLKSLPIDPFSGSPFVYKRLGDDFMLYSFARDCDDDGGTKSRWGSGEQGGDQVFWPVERKRTTEDRISPLRPRPEETTRAGYVRPREITDVKSRVEADPLADPNEIRARIKAFEGLEKALTQVDRRSRYEVREWLQTRVDNRIKLVKAVEMQVKIEISFIRKVAIEEKAKKTTKAIDDLLLNRQERLKTLVKTMEGETGRMRFGERGSREIRGQRRSRLDPEERRRAWEARRSGGRLTREYTREQGGFTGMGVESPATVPERALPGVGGKNEIQASEWLKTGVENRISLAKAVQEPIKADLIYIRKLAVEERAKKTTAAIDGLLLNRQKRMERVVQRMEEQLKRMRFLERGTRRVRGTRRSMLNAEQRRGEGLTPAEGTGGQDATVEEENPRRSPRRRP